MLSRTAESLFWIGRYLERVQDLARALDVAYHARLERAGARRDGQHEWEPLLRIGGELQRFSDSGATADARSVARFMIFDSDNPNSLLVCLRHARDNANGMRDRITSEMWEVLNAFYLWLSERSLLHEVRPGNLHALCAEIKDRCFLFQGTAQGTMVHDEGWQFLRVGSFLERAAITARTIDVQYPLLLADAPQAGTPFQQWMSLLRSVSAYEAYCKAFHLGIRPEWVLEFLIYDRGFPRSIRYAVASAESSLKRISDSSPGRYANDAERVLGWLQASVAFGDRGELADQRLHPFLLNIQERCAEVSTELGNAYFAYAVPGAIA
jgi:uncharacterized alpha-E superfamily protein